MFDQIFKKQEEQRAKTKYAKSLGWKEMSEDGNMENALINCIDTNCGFGVFRQGSITELLYWSLDDTEAVEWAVDRARKEIMDHELKAQKREVQ